MTLRPHQWRLINRYVHIIAALYNLSFIYTPIHQWGYGFILVQWVSTPILIVTGIEMMYRRHHLKRQALKRAEAHTQAKPIISAASATYSHAQENCIAA